MKWILPKAALLQQQEYSVFRWIIKTDGRSGDKLWDDLLNIDCRSDEVLSFEEFLHLFPPLFGIILCVLSWADEVYINAKLRAELESEGVPDGQILATQDIANGAVALSSYILNVLLFNAGSLLAIFDWPPCLIAGPLIACIIFLAVAFHDVLVKAVSTPLSRFQSPAATPRLIFGNISLSKVLLIDQVALNVVIIVLIVLGGWLGGAEDKAGWCTSH